MKEENKKLFERYIQPEMDFIRHVCWKYCYDKPRFEEYYNEILTNLYLYVHTYNPELGIRAWLFTIVYREMRHKMESLFCEHSLIDFVDPMELRNVNIVEEPDDGKERLRRILYDAIDRLEPLYRDIILMRLRGQTMQEIASELYHEGRLCSDNVNNIKSRMRHCYG